MLIIEYYLFNVIKWSNTVRNIKIIPIITKSIPF